MSYKWTILKLRTRKIKLICLLVHGGEYILLIHENSPESDNKDADEYAELIEKMEKI